MRIAPTTLVLMIGVLSLGLIDVPKDKYSGDRSLAPKIMLLLPAATEKEYSGTEILIRSRVKSIDVATVESEIGSALQRDITSDSRPSGERTLVLGPSWLIHERMLLDA